MTSKAHPARKVPLARKDPKVRKGLLAQTGRPEPMVPQERKVRRAIPETLAHRASKVQKVLKDRRDQKAPPRRSLVPKGRKAPQDRKDRLGRIAPCLDRKALRVQPDHRVNQDPRGQTQPFPVPQVPMGCRVQQARRVFRATPDQRVRKGFRDPRVPRARRGRREPTRQFPDQRGRRAPRDRPVLKAPLALTLRFRDRPVQRGRKGRRVPPDHRAPRVHKDRREPMAQVSFGSPPSPTSRAPATPRHRRRAFRTR